MKKLILPLFVLAICTSASFAQNVNVTGSTGADGTYLTLSAAFTAINASAQTGNTVAVSIVASTSEGTATALLNDKGWTSLTVTPSGAVSVSGGTTAGSPLIDLNGAKNVTINGLNSGPNSLSIVNTTVSATAGTSTIRFINDAANNTVTNCTVAGSEMIASSGTIFFSTGVSTGNTGNTISNCTITQQGGSLPTNAIYSAGTSASIFNSGTITGNLIQDYFSATLITAGVNLSATGNSAWTITNNKLFQTATRIYTTANTQSGIFIGTGSGYTITGNTIGFANSSGTGTTNIVGNSVALTGTFPTSYTTTGTANATRYIAINCAFTAAGAASSIQNNTIGGFALYTSSGASTTNGVWCGINVTSGNANIGTTTGNTIGATTGGGGGSAASIYTACTTTGGAAVGIFATSTNTVSIQNNTFGAVDAVGTSATLSGGFTGIDSAGTAGVFTINSNTIGNTTADNIRTGYTTVTGVSGGNLTNAGILTSTTGATGAQVGIRNTATGATLSINSNTFRGWAVGGTVTAVTGITNTGAVTTTVNNNSNLLGTSGLGWVRYAFANSGALTGILKSGTATATTIAINSNDFRGIVNSVAGTQAQTYISYQVGATNNVDGNTFTNLSVNTTGAVTFLNHGTTNSLTATGTLSSSNNQIVTAFANASVSATTFFTAGGGDSSVNGSTETYNLNNFSNATLTGASAVILLSDANGASSSNGPTKTISNNTFNNITTGNAQITGISFNFSGNNTTVSNNTLTNLTGGLILSLAAGTSNGGATETISGNTFSNFTATGQINALQTGFGVITTGNITGNTITNLSTTSAAANPIFALICSGFGTTTNISKNKIGNVQSTGNALAGSVVFGILAQTAGTTYNISNNLVGDLRLPANPAANNLLGISIGTLTAGTTVNLSSNTVWLNESVNAQAGFGSSAVSASTTPTVVMRDNILVNTSVQNTTGLTVAYRRSDATLTTYGAASNNNDFYAGTPGANNLIYNDATNSDQTIAAYKTRVASRDSASFTENPTFLSTVASPTKGGKTAAPASANFLHIDPTVATQIESGGIPVAGITDDFDGDTRNVTTPDVGGDEFSGVPLDLSPPNIAYTPLANTAVTGNRTLTATITDATGVPTAGAGLPVLYWRINAGSYTAATATSLGMNQYQFTFGVGAGSGDSVFYYVVAQDTATTPNVISNPSAGASGFTANPPAASTPPTTPSSYSILQTISGSFGVGTAMGATYPTLTAAVADLNNKVMNGTVTFTLTDATYPSETFPIVINANPGSSSMNTVTIKPGPSVTASLSGASASGPIIKLNGASFVTIDGSNSGGTDRSLTITNTSATTPNVVWFGSIGTTPITNDVLKNCVVINGINSSSAVVISDAATSGNAGFFSNITVQNNSVQKAFIGVFANGGTTPQNGSNLIYSQNDLSTSGANAIRICPLYMQGVNGATVSQNTVGNVESTTAETKYGIWLATGTINATVSGNTVSTIVSPATGTAYGINVTSGVAVTNNVVSGNTVSGVSASITSSTTPPAGISVGSGIETTTGTMTIQQNNVSNIANINTGTYAAYGILLNGGNNVTVVNNFVSNIMHDMTGGIAFNPIYAPVGIYLKTGTGHKVYYNSVNLFGALIGAANSALLDAAFAIDSTTSTGCDVRDNIFANNITGGTTSIAHVSVYLPSSGTSAMNLTWNNNAYYFGTDATAQGTGQAGTTAGSNFFTTLPALAAYSSTLSVAGTNDNASLASTAAVPFISSTNLHLASPAAPVANAGTPIGGITADFDGDTRSVTTPDIGADEIPTPTITVTGSLAAFSTTYGTASTVQTLSVAGSALVANITATAPAGYEVASDGVTYGATATFIQTGGSASGTLSIRLAALTAPSTVLGTNLAFTSTAATTQNVAVSGTVNKFTPTVSATGTTSLTYTGSPQGPSGSTVTQVSGGATPTGAVTFSYVGTGATTYGPSATQPTDAGTYAVTASYPGDANYNSASSAPLAFTIAKATPTATLAVSNSPVTYTGSAQAATVGITTSSVPGSVTNIMTGGAATQTNAGTYPVTADFVPTDMANYNTLAGLSAGDFVIDKANQTISGLPLTDTRFVGDAPYSLGLTGGGSGNAITYVSSNTGVATVDGSGTVTLVAAGSTTITASQAGNANYNPATDAVQTLTVNPLITLDVGTHTTATFNGTDTTIMVNFVGVPNQTYVMEYSTDLVSYLSAGAPISTTGTGSFTMTITAAGDQTAAWNTKLFFRASRQP